ncbi:MAG: DNA cytosine methyltransferase [Acidobacteriota bacterium]
MRRRKQAAEPLLPIKVFDFFSGCGGTSAGLREAGMEIVFGLDSDADAEATFKANFPTATFLNVDVTTVRADRLRRQVAEQRPNPILFCGCAPCQPFSQQTAPKRRKEVV